MTAVPGRPRARVVRPGKFSPAPAHDAPQAVHGVAARSTTLQRVSGSAAEATEAPAEREQPRHVAGAELGVNELVVVGAELGVDELVVVAVVRALAADCFELLSLRREGAGRLHGRVGARWRAQSAYFAGPRRARIEGERRLGVRVWQLVRDNVSGAFRLEGYGDPDREPLAVMAATDGEPRP